MSWEERPKKLAARRPKMRVQVRGLLTVEPMAIRKRLERMHTAARSRRNRR